MKKYILACAAFGLLAACNNNKAVNTTEDSVITTDSVKTTEVVSAAGAPAFSFTKDVYDFGKIKEGEKVSYDFEFKNTGKAPLIIKDAVATCGCTVPEWPKEPVAAGESAKINVVFDSAGKTGLQDKVVTITANTIPAETQIHLIGEVTK